MTIFWWMILEIWSATDRIFCHSGPFFPLLSPYGPIKLKFWIKWKKYLKIWSFYKQKWQSYDAWFLRYGVQRAEFFVILDCFLPFYPLTTAKKKNFEKLKKASRDIIILHMCTLNNIHMMYGSWDMERDGQNFLSFWTIFCPFTPLTIQKIKFWKNEGKKKHLEILSFFTSVP